MGRSHSLKQSGMTFRIDSSPRFGSVRHGASFPPNGALLVSGIVDLTAEKCNFYKGESRSETFPLGSATFSLQRAWLDLESNLNAEVSESQIVVGWELNGRQYILR